MNGVRIALLFLLFTFMGYLGNTLGITTTPINAPSTTILQPNGTWIDTFRVVLLPLVWVFNAIGGFFQLMTFQADIPVMVNGLIVLAVVIFSGYTFVRLIRGGG